jgi:ribonuclease G
MSTELIINASLPETRIALMENGEIQELLIERASDKGIVGNIYKGRVTRVLPGMQAAFVDIGLEKAAFLYVDDVYVHSEVFEEDESPEEVAVIDAHSAHAADQPHGEVLGDGAAEGERAAAEGETATGSHTEISGEENRGIGAAQADAETAEEVAGDFDGDEDALAEDASAYDVEDLSSDLDDVDDEDDGDEGEPTRMGPPPGEGDGDSDAGAPPEGTIAPPADHGGESQGEAQSAAGEGGEVQAAGEGQGEAQGDARRKHRRGRRGGRNRRGRTGREREVREGAPTQAVRPVTEGGEAYPENYQEQVLDKGMVESDRAEIGAEAGAEGADASNRPTSGAGAIVTPVNVQGRGRPEFRESRGRDRRIKSKSSSRPPRGQVNIQDLLKEGQEVLVQVAKDPIATKGARLTCHISLPGRHLVCMPTIDHVGVSRRIDNDSERRKLREYVERNKPRNLGFIVRTASGRNRAEERIKQDIDYLTRLWGEIREKAASVTAPALVYEDLNSVLRAIRDWVTEDIDKIVVDSRFHYNEILKFVSHFMPSLRQKVDLYHGDIPIFDAYNISTELARSLERKVWLKSGGYIVIDQAEALVAIDVNTGRYVGKKNLEDTILKTNLEAVQEIAYQLRLRNCGGIIILDLIDMEKEENKQRVYRALEDALKKDRARPTILKISELGLVEMTRKRTRDTLVRALCDSCSHCEGKGFVKSKQTVAYEVMREIEREGVERDVSKILIQAHADVIDVLAIDERETLDQLERRYRKQIYLQSVGDFHPEQYEVVGERRDGASRTRESSRAETRERDGGRDRGRGRERGRGGDRERSGEQPAAASSGREGGSNEGGDRESGRGKRGRRGRGRDRDRGGERHVANVTPRVTPLEPGAQAAQGEGVAGEPNFGGEGAGAPEPFTGREGATPDFENEEDRLAFLRAQAAQDAALASLNTGGGLKPASGQKERGPGQGQTRDNGRGRRRRRGRRGGRGRFERGPETGQNLAGLPRDEGDHGGSEGGSEGGPSGGSDVGGGGGDHSTPPAHS